MATWLVLVSRYATRPSHLIPFQPNKSIPDNRSSRTLSPSSAASQETLNQSLGPTSRTSSMVRPVSPSPSAASEKNEMDLAVSTIIVTAQFPDYVLHYLLGLCVEP